MEKEIGLQIVGKYQVVTFLTSDDFKEKWEDIFFPSVLPLCQISCDGLKLFIRFPGFVGHFSVMGLFWSSFLSEINEIDMEHILTSLLSVKFPCDSFHNLIYAFG